MREKVKVLVAGGAGKLLLLAKKYVFAVFRIICR
jgi:hypothetical protein